MDYCFEYKKFKVEDDTIYWEDDCYPLSSVRHLIYRRVLTVQRQNLVKVGEAHSSLLGIVLDNEYVIEVTIDEETILFGINRNKKEILELLYDTYIYLAKKTFEKRISPYIQQIEKHGFFEYKGVKFYPHLKITTGKSELFLENTHFYRKHSSLTVKPKYSGFTGRIKSFFSAIEIPTYVDTDVFFSLLDRYMGLQW